MKRFVLIFLLAIICVHSQDIEEDFVEEVYV